MSKHEPTVIVKGETDSTLSHVQAWRMEQLHKASYDESSAWMLAQCAHVDLHYAVELVTLKGCSPAQALLILL